MSIRETLYEQISFITYHEEFDSIVGPKPKVLLLANASESGLALYHEACVYDAKTRSVFVTSNQLTKESNVTNDYSLNKQVKLFRIYDSSPKEYQALESAELSIQVEEVQSPTVSRAMLNGGVNYDSSTILFCAQGTQNPDDPAGLLLLRIPDPTSSDVQTELILKDFYGIPFNSLNDVIVHPEDGSVWFTDPCYGYHQGIRSQPQLPNQVYRFDPRTKSVRAVADGFVRPNGLCFSPNLQTLYITDTGAIHGSDAVSVDLQRPSHIYAYDIVYPSSTGVSNERVLQPREPFLINRRLFACAPGRFPDGIKCDITGNVYAGCGDGIEVWNDGGTLLGIIKVDGGIANFCFGEGGCIYACNEIRFWKIQLCDKTVRGALLGI